MKSYEDMTKAQIIEAAKREGVELDPKLSRAKLLDIMLTSDDDDEVESKEEEPTQVVPAPSNTRGKRMPVFPFRLSPRGYLYTKGAK